MDLIENYSDSRDQSQQIKSSDYQNKPPTIPRQNRHANKLEKENEVDEYQMKRSIQNIFGSELMESSPTVCKSTIFNDINRSLEETRLLNGGKPIG